MTNVLHFPRDILKITYASMISFRGVFFKLNKIGTNFKVVYNNLSVISPTPTVSSPTSTVVSPTSSMSVRLRLESIRLRLKRPSHGKLRVGKLNLLVSSNKSLVSKRPTVTMTQCTDTSENLWPSRSCPTKKSDQCSCASAPRQRPSPSAT